MKTREELGRAPATRREDDPPRRAKVSDKPVLPRDWVLQASPWIDFSFTSFWMDERTDNFLNLGVEVGGYFIERLRISAMLVAPLGDANDSYHDYDRDSFLRVVSSAPSPSVAALYGASLGLILSNSRTFVFAPGISMWRTDVNDYGTSGALSLPFEWTTHRHLRVGFELALGHAFGGEVHHTCNEQASVSACGASSIGRPGGTAILAQYHMGWALSGM